MRQYFLLPTTQRCQFDSFIQLLHILYYACVMIFIHLLFVDPFIFLDVFDYIYDSLFICSFIQILFVDPYIFLDVDFVYLFTHFSWMGP